MYFQGNLHLTVYYVEKLSFTSLEVHNIHNIRFHNGRNFVFYIPSVPSGENKNKFTKIIYYYYYCINIVSLLQILPKYLHNCNK